MTEPLSGESAPNEGAPGDVFHFLATPHLRYLPLLLIVYEANDVPTSNIPWGRFMSMLGHFLCLRFLLIPLINFPFFRTS